MFDSARQKKIEEMVTYASAGTQTSPGLAGLRPHKKKPKTQ